MTRWVVALLVSATSSGCYCSHARELDAGPSDAGSRDAAMIDAPVEHFEGCDDPRIWEVAAPEATPDVTLGGESCDSAQYPASWGVIDARIEHDFPDDERRRLTRSCWRVTAAHPTSRWEVGRVLDSSSAGLGISVIGHERPVTFEGRVIRDDGVVRLSVHDAVVALDAPWVLDGDLTELVALGMTGEGLARARSVSLDRVVHVTEGEVIAATGSRRSGLLWLERVGSELFFRVYDRYPEPAIRSVSLGSPTEAQLAPRGAVVLLDRHEVVILQEDDLSVAHRVIVADEVDSIVAGYPAVLVHAGGELIAFDYGGVEQWRHVVGPGTLLPGPSDWYQPPYFWDGTRVIAIERRDGSPRPPGLVLDESRAFEPSPEDLAITGELLAVGHGVLIGREGFVYWPRYGAAPPGPRAVGARELYGAPITHVAADTISYVVTRPDGSATAYRVPYAPLCP